MAGKDTPSFDNTQIEMSESDLTLYKQTLLFRRWLPGFTS